MEPHPVDGIQMVVVPVGLTFLRVDVLPQGSVEVGCLQIMGGQRVARQHGMDKAACDEPGEGVACVVVKGEGGPHHPDHLAVVPFVAQQFIELVIVPGKGGLPGAALPEGKHISGNPALPEAVRVDEDPLLSLFCAADGHQLSLPQAAEFPDVDAAPIPHGHAVHPALPGQMPLPCDFEVFRKDAHGVEILRRHAVPGRRAKDGVRCVFQCGCGKDRRKIGAQLKRHNGVPPLKDGAAVPPGCREEKPGDRSSQYLRSSLQAHRHSHPARGRGRFDCIQNIRMPPKKQGPFL